MKKKLFIKGLAGILTAVLLCGLQDYWYLLFASEQEYLP